MTRKGYLLVVSAQRLLCKTCKIWNSLVPRKNISPQILIVSPLNHTDRTRIKKSLSLILVKCSSRRNTRKPVTPPTCLTRIWGWGIVAIAEGPVSTLHLEVCWVRSSGSDWGSFHISFHQRKDYCLSHDWEHLISDPLMLLTLFTPNRSCISKGSF